MMMADGVDGIPAERAMPEVSMTGQPARERQDAHGLCLISAARYANKGTRRDQANPGRAVAMHAGTYTCMRQVGLGGY